MIEATPEKNGRVHLRGEATIHNVFQVREKLLAILTQFPQVTSFDIDNLSDIDTAGIQLLLSLKKSHPSMIFHCRNDRTLELVTFLGLADILSNE